MLCASLEESKEKWGYDASEERGRRWTARHTGWLRSGHFELHVWIQSSSPHRGVHSVTPGHIWWLFLEHESVHSFYGDQVSSLQFPFLMWVSLRIHLISRFFFLASLFKVTLSTQPKRKRGHSSHPFIFLPCCTGRVENLQREIKEQKYCSW